VELQYLPAGKLSRFREAAETRPRQSRQEDLRRLGKSWKTGTSQEASEESFLPATPLQCNRAVTVRSGFAELKSSRRTRKPVAQPFLAVFRSFVGQVHDLPDALTGPASRRRPVTDPYPTVVRTNTSADTQFHADREVARCSINSIRTKKAHRSLSRLAIHVLSGRIQPPVHGAIDNKRHPHNQRAINLLPIPPRRRNSAAEPALPTFVKLHVN
jgi:hypothetical protein